MASKKVVAPKRLKKVPSQVAPDVPFVPVPNLKRAYYGSIPVDVFKDAYGDSWQTFPDGSVGFTATGGDPNVQVKPPRVRTRTVTKIVEREPDLLAGAIASLPQHMRKPVQNICADPQLNAGVMEMMGRHDEIDVMSALLSGIGLVPAARAIIDDHLDALWAKSRNLPRRDRYSEVVIGAGLQAAVYCAVRVKLGYPAPLVLEARDRVGGVFAVSRGPSFYLNSRNRPGPLSVPGVRDGSLNFLPNAPLQPSHMSGDEYQTNDVMAWVIRLTLAMNAKVVTGVQATFIDSRRKPNLGYYDRTTEAFVQVSTTGNGMRADRAIITTGLAVPRDSTGIRVAAKGRVMNFEEFMAKMDSPFPLRGFDRVAVLGGGDGGKTTIEALTGKGPRAAMSVAALDWPRTICWYGAPYLTRQDWERCNRSRYNAIGALLPSPGEERAAARVTPFARPSSFTVGYECVYVDDVPFDYLIDCTGYAGTSLATTGDEFGVGGRAVGFWDKQSVYRAGVAAGLVLTPGEQTLLRGIAENATSAFRYSSRTAALAANLPGQTAVSPVLF